MNKNKNKNKINANNDSTTKLRLGILAISVIAVLMISPSSVIQYAYATNAPIITSLVANDPDDLDEIYSVNDTITVTFDSNTNEPGGAGIQSGVAVDDLFTFTESIGQGYIGQWSTSDTFTITIKNVNNATLVISVTTVTPTGTTPILSSDETSSPSSVISPVLSGDFGVLEIPPSDIWIEDEGTIYYNGGNVGIGTTLPSHLLSVDGTIESTSGGFMFPDGTIQTTANAGNIEEVTAGIGLLGGGTTGSVTLDVDTSSIQSRVTGSCSVGSSISVINEDGTVSCEVDDDTIVSSGEVFVKWGSIIVPAGTTMLYSGIAMNSYYIHTGGPGDTICIASDFERIGTAGNENGALILPALTMTSGSGIPLSEIPHSTAIQCTVLLSDTPVLQIWGKSTGPPGWTKIYSGYAMGSHYTDVGGGDRICVDNENFDDSIYSSDVYASLYYATEYENPSVGGLPSDLENWEVSCAVFMKNS